ncbi:MAG: DUF4097 family beta strand repeat protein [Anaerolineales bacterium]|nr:DUF4097 family beta strand repeat protein [Anaerolineales bacterium]
MGVPRSIEVGIAPVIVMKRVSGDLTISGWDRPELQIRARHARNTDEIGVNTLGEIIEISSHDDCVIQAPLQSQLQIEQVDGDLTVHMVLGSITIGSANGDAALASVGATTIGRVSGDLSARGIAGSFVVNKISGDARIVQVAGAAQLGQVSGDATLSEIVGNVECAASGDVKLLLNLAPNQHVSAEASGDLSCHIQTDAGAKVELEADGDIRIKNLGETRRASHTTLAFQWVTAPLCSRSRRMGTSP